MTTNDRDAQALTYLAIRLRTNTYGAGPWDEHGTYENVKRLIGQNLALSIERVCHNAADPKAQTPGSIHRKFKPAGPSLEDHGHPHPPRKVETCTVPGHEGYRASPCGGCHADQLAGDPVPERRPASASLAAVNAARVAGGYAAREEA